MKLSGTQELRARPGDVWAFLNDPQRLVRCLPGCEKLEPAGADRYRAKVKFGLAAITGEYVGEVVYAEKKPPTAMRLRVEGKGTPGFMKAEGRLELSETKGGTQVAYEGDAQVGGLIASVGQRMIEAAARKIIQQFFECAGKELKAVHRQK